MLQAPVIALLGRILFSLIFIFSSFGHFTQQYVQYAAAQGVPLPSFLVPLSGLMAFLGGVSILLGFKARYGAWLIILFLIPVTLFMHKFWGLTDPSQTMMQYINFMKNTAMLGGALLIAYFGSGPLSVDRK
ncbi:MAG: DoxX family protein [Parachlamydia sp.]|nr:DoxX family protein [Parachlamydia sp.]